MEKIRKTEKPSKIVVAMDFAAKFKKALRDQGVEIEKTMRPGELAADPGIDMDGVNTVMLINYGRYGRFAGPVMVVAKAEYDDMLALARSIAKSTAPSSVSTGLDADDAKEVESARRMVGEGGGES